VIKKTPKKPVNPAQDKINALTSELSSLEAVQHSRPLQEDERKRRILAIKRLIAFWKSKT
jgi:hypothetical protein